MRRTGVIVASLITALAGVACASTLEPAPEAQRVFGPGYSATAEASGVRIVASSDAWRGFPEDIERAVTPILVKITNDSERRIEVRYEQFGLVSPGGVLFAALPPFEMTGAVSEPVAMSTAFPVVGFGVAPYLAPWYPGWTVWSGPFPYRPSYYGTYGLAFERVNLPSGDMLQKALPEGVLGPGGRVTGFVYFEPVADVRRLVFTARLVDATTGKGLGTIEIPFVVR